MNSYSSKKMRIEWNGTYTDILTICNEKTKQCNVQSPFLFNMYLDELLFKLEAQGLECHRNGVPN